MKKFVNNVWKAFKKNERKAKKALDWVVSIGRLAWLVFLFFFKS